MLEYSQTIEVVVLFVKPAALLIILEQEGIVFELEADGSVPFENLGELFEAGIRLIVYVRLKIPAINKDL